MKSSSFKELLKLIKIILISIILIASSISAFVPMWLSNSLGTNPLMTKCIVIILAVFTCNVIFNIVSNILYETCLKIIVSDAASTAKGLSDIIDLTDDEINTAINRLTLLKESRVKPTVTDDYDPNKENDK